MRMITARKHRRLRLRTVRSNSHSHTERHTVTHGRTCTCDSCAAYSQACGAKEWPEDVAIDREDEQLEA